MMRLIMMIMKTLVNLGLLTVLVMMLSIATNNKLIQLDMIRFKYSLSQTAAPKSILVVS
jgi:hypothetical protein